ncbi:NADPH:quinone reductase-like Zn-dependent oxidoreductase [Solibacillus kalamii]|uniref:Zinc-binding alcohol dehydrogenase n=1 Tax=Solibacillus kalamii TaxID=1748298 RepID=A0ABX3ZIZ4_9BACL|nr:zinc-binding dehydrogenase [Solibacillus kalamii]MBM7663954.1 NADPH:quinone reductase-like Zn-dependent oxidoreductase [Solibacillus kalamii]OUZ39581.1 zinc-binding alcohol dehydrogenase [Solibacillus kalamii]
MKAWIMRQPGSIDEIVWEEIEDAQAPGEGQLVVKVISTALNPVDYQMIQSGSPNWIYPHYTGVDLAGEVVEVGQNVVGFNIGDRVACHTDLNKKGAFAEYTVVDALATAKIPKGVSFNDAAAILCSGMTAYETIFQKFNHVQKQTILIHGGAGGVGGIAIQLAKELGLKVFTTASSTNHSWVKSLGADIVIDYRTEDVTKRILEETNEDGVDLIFNTISSAEATEDLQRLAFSGQLAYIAGKPDLSVIKPFSLSPSIHEVALGAAHRSGSIRAKENLAFMANELMQRVKKGTLNPMVNEVLPREELPTGLKKLKDRHVRGKIIIRMQP